MYSCVDESSGYLQHIDQYSPAQVQTSNSYILMGSVSSLITVLDKAAVNVEKRKRQIMCRSPRFKWVRATLRKVLILHVIFTLYVGSTMCVELC